MKWFASSVAVIVIAVHQLRYIREPAANLQAIGREGTHEFTHPPAVTAFVSKARPPQVWTEEIGRLTVMFGLGRCIGRPRLHSLWRSRWHRSGLFASVGILAVAGAAAACQREP